MDRNLHAVMTYLQNSVGVKRRRSGQGARIDKPDAFLPDSLSKVGMAIQDSINTAGVGLFKQTRQTAFDPITVTVTEQQPQACPLTDQFTGGR